MGRLSVCKESIRGRTFEFYLSASLEGWFLFLEKIRELSKQSARA